MKTFTTDPTFKNFRFSRYSIYTQGELLFPNGWGVSVSRRANDNLWEAASTLVEGPLNLDNPIFNGKPIGWLTESEIEKILAEVFSLDPLPLEQRPCPEQASEE